MPWISDEVLRQRVAAYFQFDDPSQLGTRFNTIIPDANIAATAELTQFLTGMGYTIGQVNSWDDRIESIKAYGLMKALIFAGAWAMLDAETKKTMDPRVSIREAGGITIGGVPTSPTMEASQVGGVASGTLGVASQCSGSNLWGWSGS